VTVPQDTESAATVKPTLPDGLVAFVKRDCPTCVLVAPVLAQLLANIDDGNLTIYTQDDPNFPYGLDPVSDTSLGMSWHHNIETLPTVVRVVEGVETERIVGWSRQQWEVISGVDRLGADLPDMRPGCGSLSVDPTLVDELRVRFAGSTLHARRIELAVLEDDMEAMFDRGWSDGLPLVPPTESRVLAMLEGTSRHAQDVVAIVPPDLVEATVEKVAINAVMAGCKPEYLPVVLAGVEALCTDEFNIHGLLATTMPAGPVLIVNGPIANRIGMNSGHNVLGQGNRANSTIGRAVQLVVRNVGGGRPGEIDRATHGQPGKLSFCFAEDEANSPWAPLNADFGYDPGTNTVTAFAGEGVRCVVDQISRKPDSLARSLAGAVSAMLHHKLILAFDALLVIGPEHARVFAEAGWDKSKVRDTIVEYTKRSGSALIRGADGIEEGIPDGFAEATDLPKVRPDGGLMIVHAGSDAGLFTQLISGWVNGATGSQPVCQLITDRSLGRPSSQLSQQTQPALD